LVTGEEPSPHLNHERARQQIEGGEAAQIPITPLIVILLVGETGQGLREFFPEVDHDGYLRSRMPVLPCPSDEIAADLTQGFIAGIVSTFGVKNGAVVQTN
jgi:hypothetical protein